MQRLFGMCYFIFKFCIQSSFQNDSLITFLPLRCYQHMYFVDIQASSEFLFLSIYGTLLLLSTVTTYSFTYDATFHSLVFLPAFLTRIFDTGAFWTRINLHFQRKFVLSKRIIRQTNAMSVNS